MAREIQGEALAPAPRRAPQIHVGQAGNPQGMRDLLPAGTPMLPSHGTTRMSTACLPPSLVRAIRWGRCCCSPTSGPWHGGRSWGAQFLPPRGWLTASQHAWRQPSSEKKATPEKKAPRDPSQGCRALSGRAKCKSSHPFPRRHQPPSFPSSSSSSSQSKG